MTAGTEQVAAINRSNVDTALALAEISSEAVDKLAELNLNAVKTVVASGIKAIREIAGSTDVTDLTARAGAWVEPTWQRNQAYVRDAYAVLSASQAQIAALLEQRSGEFSRNVAAAIDAALKNAPAGSEAAAGALKLVVQSANAVYEPILRAGRQAVEANLAAVPVATPKKKAA